jgi:quercetin dioxygenase-like cupin family protein
MHATRIARAEERTVLELLDGNKLEPLTESEESAYCVMKGTLPAGWAVPLHSHSQEDAESFYVLAGEAQVLKQTGASLVWQTIKPGDFVYIPGGTRHAFRNLSRETMEALITCTAKIGDALREMAQVTPTGEQPSVTPENIQRMAEISTRYGFWLGTAEQNAEVGISLAA